MGQDQKVECFREWLGPLCQTDKYNESWVSGFLLTSRGQTVADEHVAVAVQFAEESGMATEHVDRMRELGALMVRFEGELASGTWSPGQGPSPAFAPQNDFLGDIPEPVGAAGLELAEGTGIHDEFEQPREELAAPTPAPHISATPPAVEEVAAPPRQRTEPSWPPPADVTPERAKTQSRPSPAPEEGSAAAEKSGSSWVGALVVLVLLVGGAAAAYVFVFEGKLPSLSSLPFIGGDEASDDGEAPMTPEEVDASDLPKGWQKSGPKTFVRGLADDPDQTVFVETTPATPGKDEKALASAAESAVAERIEAKGGAYKSIGCEPANVVGTEFSACRGAAVHAGKNAVLTTYVGRRGESAIVAVSVAKQNATNSPAHATALLAAILSE